MSWQDAILDLEEEEKQRYHEKNPEEKMTDPLEWWFLWRVFSKYGLLTIRIDVGFPRLQPKAYEAINNTTNKSTFLIVPCC